MNPAENYILKQPEPYQEILLYLQAVIEKTIPELELKFKYRLPFYYLNNKPFCYFNASHKKKFVDVGFCNGKRITMHQDALVIENRKKMASLRYTSLNKIDENILTEVLENAIELQ